MESTRCFVIGGNEWNIKIGIRRKSETINAGVSPSTERPLHVLSEEVDNGTNTDKQEEERETN